jgi:FAD/FMN-containing dehydrogenase
MTASRTNAIAAAFQAFTGPLVWPDDGDYERARRIYNGRIEARPAVIAQCHRLSEIQHAIAAARHSGVEASVRSGGHSVAGRCSVDDGVMVDLSSMKAIRVNAADRTARVEPGVTWGELNRATQQHGLAVTGGVVSTTGVAGLTLGGGIGYLIGRHGLASDNLLSARVVTADGRQLTASPRENEDLFWALRGGGGNFGIVASFDYRLHPVGPTIIGGKIAHPFAAARDVLRFYRGFTADAPDDLEVYCWLRHTLDTGEQIAGMTVCHIGRPERARRELQRALAFGSPREATVGPMPYTDLNAMLDPSFPTGSLNYWKSSFLDALSDEAIDTMVDRFAACPSPMSVIVLEHFHGAVTRVPVTATAFPHRRPGYDFLLMSVWRDPDHNDENERWTGETFAAMEPFFSSERYANYLVEDDTGDAPVHAAYGPNYHRLVKVKDAFDPDNFFHHNVNVQPTRPAASASHT